METEVKNTSGAKHEFAASQAKLLRLVIDAFYSNKDTFLRELISNAADACEKLSYATLTDNSLWEDDAKLSINISYSKSAKILTIRDNGIGMNTDEVKENLGTIAKSGTEEFIAKIKENQDESNLIGQFGVGFYSGFMVANKVIVRTRKAGDDNNNGVIWSSDGINGYNVEQSNISARGTEIELHIKADAEEYLNEWKLENIIKQYSNHISTPVILHVETTKEIENNDSDDTKAEKKTEIVIEEKVINSSEALWVKDKSKITDEEYEKFCETQFHGAKPLTWIHNKVESSRLNYISLLFIPEKAPFNFNFENKRRGVKLYVKRVLILDDADKFLPNYLRFVSGIVDSSDLDLNISRELLQDNRSVDSIKSALTKKVIGSLKTLLAKDKEKYTKFWQEFGNVLKEGPVEDFANRDQILDLLLFSSTNSSNHVNDTSFTDYVSRMKKGQKKIYFCTADSYLSAKNSPHLEAFKEKDVEVLLLTDKVDEWLVSNVMRYKDYQLQSVSKGDLDDLDFKDESSDNKDEKSESETAKVENKLSEEQQKFIDKVKSALSDHVREVRSSVRLRSFPSCVVVDDYDMSMHMERLMRAAGQSMEAKKPILELNLNHPILQKLQNGEYNDKFNDICELLLDQAILADGGTLSNPANFITKINELYFN